MFENLLGQDEAALALSADIEAERLPPALLFAGPPASGKITAALELARALSCARELALALELLLPLLLEAPLLVHPDLALLGPRSFPEEIPAAPRASRPRSRGPASAFFFARAARKLARRFDAVLYEGEEARLAKAAPLLRELEEELDARRRPERATRGRARARSRGGRGQGRRAPAPSSRPSCPSAPPVFMIRNLEYLGAPRPAGRAQDRRHRERRPHARGLAQRLAQDSRGAARERPLRPPQLEARAP